MSSPYFIGICGGSASGKTSIAQALSNDVKNGQVPIVSLDWYYLPLNRSAVSAHNWDHPDSFDWDLFNEHMNAWARGESVWTPRHDYANYKRICNVSLVESSPIMIFEGILLFSNVEVRKKLNIMIYVKCDVDVALKRRITRDIKERGYSLNEVLDRYTMFVKPAFDNYIAPAEKISHFTIYNNGSEGITNGEIITHKGVDMIADYIKLKLGLPVRLIINQKK